MKEIMAIIRMNKMNETKRVLADAGFPSMTACANVLGRGKGQVDYKIMKAAADGHPEAIAQLGKGPRLVPKRLVSMIVKDTNVDKAVNTLIKVNQTGNAGDGKIFIVPVADSFRVRTGERGNDTLD